jgi:hypothetical protein
MKRNYSKGRVIQSSMDASSFRYGNLNLNLTRKDAVRILRSLFKLRHINIFYYYNEIGEIQKIRSGVLM